MKKGMLEILSEEKKYEVRPPIKQQIALRLDQATWDKLCSMAEALGVSRNWFLTKIIQHAWDER